MVRERDGERSVWKRRLFCGQRRACRAFCFSTSLLHFFSLVSERHHGIHARRSARGNEARQERHEKKQECHTDKR
jgi:hypothetical protein